jgi:phosphoglycolate phosphatase-like HAD superfamily hydrolase
MLDTWSDSPTRDAIVAFVERVTEEGGADFVPPAERVAVFDNDGTLWCEKPMPIELGFLLQRFAEMAERDASLRTRQPWRAAHERDYAWVGAAMTKHYDGDDTDVRILMGAIVEAFAGESVEHYADGVERYLRGGAHPTLGRGLLECAYAPMIELLRHLEAHGFTNYIASGGDRDFMRPVTHELYAIPSERVIGSSNALQWTDDEHGGAVRYQSAPDVFDDGPVKPVRIWSRIGRRPIVAAGNSDDWAAVFPAG